MARTAPSSLSLAEAYEHCRNVAKERARNFYFAFLTLPRNKRQALYAVYAFCRACDDYADGDGEPQDKLAMLEGQRASLAACFRGEPEGLVFVALQDVAREFRVPQSLFDEVITGVEMDLKQSRYATFDDLRTYCYHVASVVGLITIEILGYDGPRAKKPALDLGIAMQLVNVLRDIREDAERDRVYLPQEDLARFGYSEAELLGGVMNDRFVALMEFEAERARSYFRSGAALVPMVSRGARACPSILGGLYSTLLDRIQARKWDVFSQRISLPTREKLWLATRTWLETAFNRAPAFGKS